MTPSERLLDVFHRAAHGDFPKADGGVELVPPPGPDTAAVVAFTAHHFVAGDVDADWLAAMLAADPIGIPLTAGFLQALGNELSLRAGILDAVLASNEPGANDGGLVEVGSGFEHPRLATARLYRRNVRAFATTDGSAFVSLGRGWCGRLELSFEVAPHERGKGVGRRLIRAAQHIAAAEPLFAQVAPGNAASLRALLACGFAPVAAEVLFRPAAGE